MELEVWPNFLLECRRRNLPVLVINGRLTSTSFSRYAVVKPIARFMFRQLRLICAQEQTYADRFIALGADSANVRVTGTMKFDTADVTDTVSGAAEIAAAVGLGSRGPNHPIWVCGSTGPGEEALILAQYQKLLPHFPQLRLILVPRKPERFNEVAALITASGFSCLRRTRPTPSPTPSNAQTPPVILIDTMGELRAVYSLADIVFVGRTLVDLGPRQHGSDMIEPAALAKCVLIGPFTGNFAEPMEKFLAASAMKVVNTASELGQQIEQLLLNPTRAQDLGRRARQVVLAEQGATERHAKAILELLTGSTGSPK
jgi:3-deoxy-D-manno-octulosonic-acid transferase